MANETEAPKKATPRRRTKISKKKRAGQFLLKHWWKILIAVLLLICLSFVIKGYVDTKNELTALKNPTTAGGTELQSVVNAVSDLADVPSNETPSMYTVSDKTKLGSEAFFKDAQNGDRLLFFPSSRKLVLYRPSTDKIIGLTVLNISSEGTKQTPAGTTQNSAPTQ